MAEEVTKVVENIDRLFSEIVVNGESHTSNRYVPPEPAQSNPPASTSQEEPQQTQQTQQTQPAQPVQGQYVKAVELNSVLHDLKDEDLGTVVERIESLIPSEASTLNQLADKDYVDSADSAMQSNISDIEALIPNQASAQNQLADKDFVNSSISTNTANFLGTYTTLADIEAIQNPTDNDYAFLQTTDSAGNTQFDRYKYNAESQEWLYEYTLNNSSFTAEQWATINSGLTQSSVESEISDAINALDVASSGGSGKYISVIEQTDGKISATEGTIDSTPTSGSGNPVSSDGVYQALQNAGGSVKYLTTASTTSPVVITNAPAISAGDIVKIWFTANIMVANNTTGLVISYNGIRIPAMLNYSGTLSAFFAKKYYNINKYQYFQQNTVVDFLYDGTNFIVQGLPVAQNPASTTGIMTMSDGMLYPTAGYVNNQLATKLGKEQFSIGQGQSYSFIMAEGTCALIAYIVRTLNGEGGLTFVAYDNSKYGGRVDRIVTPSSPINIYIFSSGAVTISSPYAMPVGGSVVGSVIRL